MTSGGGDVPPRAHPSDIARLARGGMLSLVGVVGNGLLQLALTVVVARGLHAHGTGVFFQAVALFMILSKIVSFGADTGLIRAVPRFRALGQVADVRRTVGVALAPVLAMGVLLGSAFFAFTPQLAEILLRDVKEPGALRSIRFLGLFLPLTAASTVILQGTRGFGTTLPFVAVENLGKPAARLALVLIALAAGLGVAGVILLWAIPGVVGFAIAVALLARLVRRIERRAGVTGCSPRPIRELAAEFWRFSFLRGIAGVLQVTILWLGVLLVGALSSTREAGVYGAASRYVIAGAFGLQAVRLAISPQFSGLLARGDLDRTQRLYQVSTWWTVGVSWPVYVMLAVFAPFFLRLFGEEFVAGETALVILCLAMLVNIGVGNASVLVLMGGKSLWNLLNSAVSLGVYVALSLFLIPRYGIEGAALAWAVGIVVNNLAPLLELHLWLRVRPFGAGYPRVALAALACYGLLGVITRALFGTSPIVVAAFGLAASALYILLLARHSDLLQLGALRDAVRQRLGGPPIPGSE